MIEIQNTFDYKNNRTASWMIPGGREIQCILRTDDVITYYHKCDSEKKLLPTVSYLLIKIINVLMELLAKTKGI